MINWENIPASRQLQEYNSGFQSTPKIQIFLLENSLYFEYLSMWLNLTDKKHIQFDNIKVMNRLVFSIYISCQLQCFYFIARFKMVKKTIKLHTSEKSFSDTLEIDTSDTLLESCRRISEFTSPFIEVFFMPVVVHYNH